MKKNKIIKLTPPSKAEMAYIKMIRRKEPHQSFDQIFRDVNNQVIRKKSGLPEIPEKISK